MIPLLLLAARLTYATTQPTLDQHTKASPLYIAPAFTFSITGNVALSTTTLNAMVRNPNGTTTYGVDVLSQPPLPAGTATIGLVASGYRYIYWTQSYTGVSAFFSVTGTGQSFGKSSICLRQVEALMGGTYSFTLQGFVNTLMPGVLIGTFANSLDNTTQNNATASMTTFPFVQFNLTACTKCSSTTWISTTLFIATN